MTLSSSATPLLGTEPSLKMGLQSVLRSLDVGLEDELARYRRKKRLQRAHQPSKVVRSASRSEGKPAESSRPVQEARAALGQLTQSPGLGDKLFPKSQSLQATETAAVASASGVAVTETTVAKAMVSKETAPQVETRAVGAVPLESSLVSLPPGESDAPSDSSNAELMVGLAPTSSPDNYFASSAALLESLSQEDEEPIATSKDRSAMVEKLLSPTGVGTSMLLLLGSATAGYLLLHPESLSHLHASNLLAKPTPQMAASSSVSPVDPELPPGAPDLSQKEFMDLTLSNLGRLNLREGSTTTAPAPLPAALPAVPSTILPANNLANSANETAASPEESAVAVTPQADQRRGLLSNLANAVAGPSPTPLAAVQAPASPATLRMAPETPLPSVSVLPSPVVLPAPAAPAPVEPAPAAETWAPPAEEVREEIAPEPPMTESFFEEVPVSDFVPSEAAEFSEPVESAVPEVDYSSDSSTEVGTFVVVVPYKSDLALSQAQQFAPDAYVRNTDAGALIQIGIHDSAETAGSVVEQLQREGLDAYVE